VTSCVLKTPSHDQQTLSHASQTEVCAQQTPGNVQRDITSYPGKSYFLCCVLTLSPLAAKLSTNEIFLSCGINENIVCVQ
jgi:hypothetical protein